MNKVIGFVIAVAVGLAFALGAMLTRQSEDVSQAQAKVMLATGAAEASRLQSLADKVAVEAEADRGSLGAAIMGRSVAYVGLGIAVAVLSVGLAFALSAFVATKAVTIYPTAGGQFPLVKIGGFGWRGLIDPNRSIGPVAIVRAPTVFDVMTDIWSRANGRPPGQAGPQMVAPLQSSEMAALQATGQANAVAMVAAATRHPAALTQTRDVIHAVTRGASLALPMPAVTRIEDASHIDRLLELEGDVIDA